MPHSKLPQQLDLRSEHGVQIEVDINRNVQYLHIDGYTAARVNGSPRTTVIRNGEEFDVNDMVDVNKAARFYSGALMANRLLMGLAQHTSAELEQLDKEIAQKIRDL